MQNKPWLEEAVSLDSKGYSWREISRILGVPRSTVSDNLRALREKSKEEDVCHEGAKILFLDVEVSPSITAAFSRFKAFASPDHVLKEPYMLTYVVKWAHMNGTVGNTVLATEAKHFDDDFYLIRDLWDFLHEADIVVAQNAKFDRGWFNQRCVVHGFNPPSPYKLVDTLAMLKKNFALPSNSLGAAAQYFNLTRKKSHSGIEMWLKCMEGDEEAFAEMLSYNDGDVVTLEELYNILQPWSQELPNLALYYNDTKRRCCGCGSEDVEETSKYAYTALSKFATIRCKTCGKYSRLRSNLRSKQQMSFTAANCI